MDDIIFCGMGTYLGIDKCTTVIAFSSGNTKSISYRGRGQGYLQRSQLPGLAKPGDFDRALRDLNTAISLMSESSLRDDREIQHAFTARAEAHALKGNMVRALQDATKVIEIDARYPDCYELRGLYHLRNKSVDLAIADFTEAIARNPQSKKAFAGRAEAFLSKGHYNDAHDDVEEALKLDPESKSAKATAAALKKFPRTARRPAEELKTISVGQEIVEARTRFEILPLVPHTGSISSIAATPDGTRIVSGSSDKTLKVWDAQTGRLIRTIKGHTDSILAVALSPDGMSLASGSADTTLKIWDIGSGALIRSLDFHTDPVDSVAFSPDGKLLASGSNRKTIMLWAAASGRLVRTIQGHAADALAFSPDGARLLAADYYKLVLLDIATGKVTREFPTPALVSPANSVAFSSDGQLVLAGYFDNTVKLWETESGELLHTFTGHSREVKSVAFASKDTHVLSSSRDGTIKLWEIQTRRLVRSINAHAGEVSSVTAMPGGKHIASSASLANDVDIRIWSFAGELIRTIGKQPPIPKSVAFSMHGGHLIWGNKDGSLAVWDSALRQLQSFRGHENSINAVAFSPDGSTILSASSDRSVKLWRLSDEPALLYTLSAETDDVISAAFSRDGSEVRAVGHGGVAAWDVKTGSRLWSARVQHRPNAAAYSRDDRHILLAGSDDQPVLVWDAGTGQLIRTVGVGSDNAIFAVDFSPDGRTMVFGRWAIDFREAQTGQLIRKVEGHEDRVDSVTYSPDGTWVVSGGGDGKVKIWEAATGRLARVLQGHTGRVNSAAWSPDGRHVISGSDDSTVRIWNASTGELLVTILVQHDGEWLAATPEGFFAASSRGSEMLSVARGLDVFSIEQFYQALYRPDLVQEKLSGDPDGKVKSAAAKLGLDKVLDSGLSPTVTITSHQREDTSQSDLVTVAADIADQGGGIGKVEWRVNGITVGIVDRPFATLTQPIALDPGDNVIEVVAYNGAGLVSSVPATAIIKWTGQAPTAKPRLHVLAVGINDYYEAKLKLKFAVPDAKSLASGVSEAGRDIYENVSVTLVLDKDATVGRLDAIFNDLKAKIRPRDVFIFYAAGHGKTEDGRYYFVPQDFKYKAGNTLAMQLNEHGIGQDRFQAWFAAIPAKKSILMFDTCESGSLTSEQQVAMYTARGGLEQLAAVGRLIQATGRTTLAASMDDQSALEGYRGHGVFTFALLDALARGDRNGNKLIEVTELIGHVDGLVPEITEQNWKKRQTPRSLFQGSDFPLAKQLAALAPAAGEQLIISTTPTHVVTELVEVLKEAGSGAVVEKLKPFTSVTLVKTDAGWSLVAKDGQALGYIPEAKLHALH
jgi:WD40 repeat protein/uncharacterized caspase-like protein